MRSLLTSPLVKGLVGGILGVVVGLLLWHVYTDHLAFHELDAYIRMVAPKINKLP